MIDELIEAGVEVAIVTSSPRPYCEKVIRHFGWPLKATVCYHDTANHKPHPDPYLAAMAKSKTDAADTIAVGDAVKDIEAAEAAGISAVAALWGSDDADALRDSGATVVCESVKELREYLLGEVAKRST